MGSTACVRCGTTLMPHSYCDVCQEVLRFVCSSCPMFTDERIHVYCRNFEIQNRNDIRKLIQVPNSSQIVLNDQDNYVQNQLNEAIFNISASYWDSIFESIKLVNRYWRRIFNIANYRQSISWK